MQTLFLIKNIVYYSKNAELYSNEKSNIQTHNANVLKNTLISLSQMMLLFICL